MILAVGISDDERQTVLYCLRWNFLQGLGVAQNKSSWVLVPVWITKDS